jgi:dienelactone hydrolase
VFEYFPQNYAWSLAVAMADGCGAELGDIDDACRPLIPLATQAGADSARAWAASWIRVADRIAADARADDARGRVFSAGAKHRRACACYMLAERQMPVGDPARLQVYRRMLEQFNDWQRGETFPVERVLVPYEGTTLPALFAAAEPGAGPCMVMFDGFDIMKETICLMGVHETFRRRGISMLVVDHPGVGEALRLQELHGMAETERPARASLEYLLTRNDVDPARIGIIAPSAGGYHAVRSAALEPRFACCVAWAGVWDWADIVSQRVRGALQQSVHATLEHAEWVYGVRGIEALEVAMRGMNLEGIAEKLRCPVLISHGANDRQTPVAQATQVYEAVVNSPRRDLRIHGDGEGGSEHCHIDNVAPAVDGMADWVAEILGGCTAPAGRADS